MAMKATGLARPSSRTGWPWANTNWNRPAWMKAAFKEAAPYSDRLKQLPLLPIFAHPETSTFRLVGTVVLTIKSFSAKRLRRDILMRVPGKPPMAVQQPVQTTSGHRTRWDMKLGPWFDQTGGRQRISIRFQIADPLLSFLWFGGHFPLTAKTEEGELLLANPLYDQGAGKWISVDLLYDPADPALQGELEYNLAVLVRDQDDDQFVLPIIIDPRMGNEG